MLDWQEEEIDLYEGEAEEKKEKINAFISSSSPSVSGQ